MRVRAFARLFRTLALLAFFSASSAHAADPSKPVVIDVPAPSEPPATVPDLDPAPDLTRFAGKAITRVEVVIDDDTWPLVAPPRVTNVHAGQPLTGASARRAIDDVLESGAFARARAVAVDDGAGVRMVVHAVQRRLVQMLRLDLHGAALERDELLREADLSEGGEVLGVDLPVYEQRIERYLTRRGFPTASVSIVSRETDDPMRVLVIVDADPGAPRVIQRRAFYVFGADSVALQPVLAGYRVDSGGRADENALGAADTALEARLRAIGHHHADVSHDLVLMSGFVTLRVRIDAGPLFELRFDGNEHYDESALSGALAIDAETDLSPGHLVQKLKDFYVNRGFLDAEVTTETRAAGPNAASGKNESARVEQLVFHIVEGERVRVGSRMYPCLKTEEIKRLAGGGPRSPKEIGEEIDSYLDEELPGADLFRDPNPRGLDATISGVSRVPSSSFPEPIDLDPDTTFAPDTYDRAALHVQELYRNEGYLRAQVGPVHVLRRACDKRSPAGRCLPVPLPAGPPDECAYDGTSLPLPVAPLDPSFTCVPDAARGVECESAVTLRIPVKLGPRTMLYDLQFGGARSLSERTLARATELVLGEPVNSLKLEDARHKLTDLYKEEGYFYADVKYTIDSSVDHTRARVRFDVVEGDQVIVRQIVIRGNERTNDSAIRRRIALEVGKPYRTSDVRKTQERIATLNVFSNVNVALDEPYVPQRDKIVVVTLVERPAQSVDYTAGVSTGEGIRGELGYAHSNIGGDAIGFSVRVRLSYLPDPLIFDPVVLHNFDTLCGVDAKGNLTNPGCFNGERLARRVTASLAFPEIGLGPLWRAQLDGVLVHDLEHDFVLDKYAAIPGLYFRPFRELQFAFSVSAEYNQVNIFGFTTINDYIQSQIAAGNPDAPGLSTLLRFPNEPSTAAAQRLVVTWDRRDDSFNPHKGTFLVSGVEHVDWFPDVCEKDTSGNCLATQSEGHTLHFTETFATYVPVTRKITFAAELRLGMNVQLTPTSTTYPDRLFFLGGVTSMRGYLQDSMITQEDADKIAQDYYHPPAKGTPFTIADVALRGGNLMVNPKLELRIPVRPPFETVLFLDAGNIWQDPTYITTNGITLRYATGTGIRVETPIGPLAFDYGINLSRLLSAPTNPRRSYEDFGAFHFAIGLF